MNDRDLYRACYGFTFSTTPSKVRSLASAWRRRLARHGYKISLGTLYPLLHGLEKKGYLRSTEQRDAKTVRKVYRATALGRKALKAAKIKVRELFGELIENK